MVVRELSPGLAEDFFDFFDGRAFADNPDWRHCYCTFYHRPDRIPAGEAARRPDRREQARALIESGTLRGYLAYDGRSRKAIGWCNANARDAYERLAGHFDRDPGVMAVVCFVVDPAHRREGVARALLEHALRDAERRGFREVQAYPAPRARSDGGNYHGPLALYESLGFARSPGKPLVVRRVLADRGGTR